MKSNKKPIPKFKNEAEERAFWHKESPLDFFDKSKAKKIVFPNLKPSTEVISLRLPAGLLNDIKVLANKKDVPYQSFMKMMLADKVGENLGDWSEVTKKLNTVYSHKDVLAEQRNMANNSKKRMKGIVEKW
jgi:predicted DNA binding CopG/RHH family protein